MGLQQKSTRGSLETCPCHFSLYCPSNAITDTFPMWCCMWIFDKHFLQISWNSEMVMLDPFVELTFIIIILSRPTHRPMLRRRMTIEQLTYIRRQCSIITRSDALYYCKQAAAWQTVPPTADSGLSSWGWKICRGVGRQQWTVRPRGGLARAGPARLVVGLWRPDRKGCQTSAVRQVRSSGLMILSLHTFVSHENVHATLFWTISVFLDECLRLLVPMETGINTVHIQSIHSCFNWHNKCKESSKYCRRCGPK